jgi:hypothetical protein
MIVCKEESEMLIAGIYDFTNWKEAFVEYLKSNGYKPSVAKDYAGRIEKIIKDENITIQKLSAEIDLWIGEYKTGKYVIVNKQKHYAPSSALMKFKDFALTTYRSYVSKPSETPYEQLAKHTDLIY